MAIADPSDMTRMQRASEALQMRLSGHTYQEVADALEWASPGAVYSAINQLMEKTVIEPTGKARAMTIARLERLLKAVWGKAIGDEDNDPKPQYIDRAIRLIESIAKYHGLERPEGEASGGGDINITQIIQNLGPGVNTPEDFEAGALQLADLYRRATPFKRGERPLHTEDEDGEVARAIAEAERMDREADGTDDTIFPQSGDNGVPV